MMNKPLRGSDVRERNEKIALHFIFQNGSASQSQIVQQTGLKPPTVSRIFAKMAKAGYIKPASPVFIQKDRKGRRPSVYCVDPASAYAIGVDFSRLAAAVIIVDFSNTVVYRDNIELSSTEQDRDTLLGAVKALISQAIEAKKIPVSSILGIAVAAPGVVNTETGCIVDYPRIRGINNYSIKNDFEAFFSLPVFVHNNASLIAASEHRYGVVCNSDHVLAILIRFGVGGALVDKGKIFLSGASTALEVGRTQFFLPSNDADTQNMLSLEEIVAEGPLLEKLRRVKDINSWHDVEKHCSEKLVAEILTDECRIFQVAVTNLIHLFHPTMILIITRFRILSRVLGNAVQRELPNQKIHSIVYDPVQACGGATDIVFSKFFSPT